MLRYCFCTRHNDYRYNHRRENVGVAPGSERCSQGNNARDYIGYGWKIFFDCIARATLVISYIGYDTKEVKVGNQPVINVSLSEDSQSIDEVVIVGASMKKSDLTGAIAHVDSKVLEERPVTTVNEAPSGTCSRCFDHQRNSSG